MKYVGIRRRSALLNLLAKHKYLRTWMIAQEIYPSRHQCQVSLKHLCDKGIVKRFRFDSREEYVYYTDQKVSAKWQHWEMLNIFHFWLAGTTKVVLCEFEVPYGPGQADGFYVIQTGTRNIKYFIEIDTVTSGDFAEKIFHYNKAYAGYWKNEWWADPLDTGNKTFPRIIVLLGVAREQCSCYNKYGNKVNHNQRKEGFAQ